MTTRRIRELGLAAGLAVVAGCSGSLDLVGTPIVSSFDLTVALGQLALGDINSYASVTGVLGSPGFAPLPSFNPLLCTFHPFDNSFGCPPIVLNQVRFDVRFFVY